MCASSAGRRWWAGAISACPAATSSTRPACAPGSSASRPAPPAAWTCCGTRRRPPHPRPRHPTRRPPTCSRPSRRGRCPPWPSLSGPGWPVFRCFPRFSRCSSNFISTNNSSSNSSNNNQVRRQGQQHRRRQQQQRRGALRARVSRLPGQARLPRVAQQRHREWAPLSSYHPSFRYFCRPRLRCPRKA
uniref:Putative secreted protein n=1 Tax=Ixodes ricinus TaxID=34613 RepID=A0A6B0V0N4_IXORI